MNTLEKLKILSAAGKYDLCSSTATKRKIKVKDGIGSPQNYGICQSYTPSGCVSLLKTLMTNSCIHDCKYCANSSHCKNTKTSFEPKELADLFMTFYLRNYVEGLFLSSGVCGNSERTSEQMLETAKILREKEKFEGYIHLKVLPGTSRDTIKQMSQYADRLSINIEAANKSRFSELNSTKDFQTDILRRMNWIKENNPSGGHTTQMVVGAGGETDKEIIQTMNYLYKKMNLTRTYFSAFTPIKNTPLEKMDKTPMIRENRLYQTDWLMREYKFTKQEIINSLNDDGFLNLKKDPKEIMAEKNNSQVNINTATYEDLIRIPGIGLHGAKKIIFSRQYSKYKSINELKNKRLIVKRSIPFITVNKEKQVRLNDYAV